MTRVPVSPAQLREFLGRDWARAEESKRESWRRRLHDEGPGALLDATQALAEHMRIVTPDWASAASRAADLEHLIRFKQRIDAASAAFNRRPRAG